MKTIRIQMYNPKTLKVKKVKVGLSWDILFFATFFGIPLFFRKLYSIGFCFFLILPVFFLISLNENFSLYLEEYDKYIRHGLNGLSTALALFGNELTAKKLLSLGWQFADPESEEVKTAKIKWKIKDQELAQD
ncbi:MAG: hypothetical protein AB7U85_08000 [Alphaproteobacteria bacterium]